MRAGIGVNEYSKFAQKKRIFHVRKKRAQPHLRT